MKILVIASATYNAQDLMTSLQGHGHTATMADNIENARAIIHQEQYDLLFLAATTDETQDRNTVSALRHNSAQYIYITTLHQQIDPQNLKNDGANFQAEFNQLNTGAVLKITQNAQNIHNLAREIGNNHIDFPSAGGIIARSAFNQLFLSALDRSNRYSEMSAILKISLDNYHDLFNIGGNYITDYAIATLSKRIVDIRRQTDIVGQIENQTFSILFQMPKNADEPIKAAQRFADTFAQDGALQDSAPSPLSIKLSLHSVPTGEIRFSQTITPKRADDTSAAPTTMPSF